MDLEKFHQSNPPLFLQYLFGQVSYFFPKNNALST